MPNDILLANGFRVQVWPISASEKSRACTTNDIMGEMCAKCEESAVFCDPFVRAKQYLSFANNWITV